MMGTWAARPVIERRPRSRGAGGYLLDQSLIIVLDAIDARAYGIRPHALGRGMADESAEGRHYLPGFELPSDEDHDGNTYRAAYTVRLAGWVYVLHAFQKKAKSGIKTPKADLDLIRARLARAEQQHAVWRRQKGAKGNV